jgi:hypothetical protein
VLSLLCWCWDNFKGEAGWRLYYVPLKSDDSLISLLHATVPYRSKPKSVLRGFFFVYIPPRFVLICVPAPVLSVVTPSPLPLPAACLVRDVSGEPKRGVSWPKEERSPPSFVDLNPSRRAEFGVLQWVGGTEEISLYSSKCSLTHAWHVCMYVCMWRRRLPPELNSGSVAANVSPHHILLDLSYHTAAGGFYVRIHATGVGVSASKHLLIRLSRMLARFRKGDTYPPPPPSFLCVCMFVASRTSDVEVDGASSVPQIKRSWQVVFELASVATGRKCSNWWCFLHKLKDATINVREKWSGSLPTEGRTRGCAEEKDRTGATRNIYINPPGRDSCPFTIFLHTSILHLPSTLLLPLPVHLAGIFGAIADLLVAKTRRSSTGPDWKEISNFFFKGSGLHLHRWDFRLREGM